MDADHRREGKSSMDKGVRLILKIVQIFAVFTASLGAVAYEDGYKFIPVLATIVGLALFWYSFYCESWIEKQKGESR